ncbi:acyl-CoA thioesterase II [Spongiactinospora rosea]|uniref:Acyl-CoA thioesterase II n=1 Tax=Spongiactinospora rosea TaxID=2248750 RepID=A0A366M472_9ACTN|nr:acyl-CoA thioesterase domain-containing protein [Spongiactinospora rosea]RBQ20623.1 acyl-CoA thioesterase II [Spongiactinospora rosea]
MNPTSETLTAALTLTPAPPERFDEAYLATSQDCPWPKAYGGDLVAQAAVAAMRSVGGDRSLHSMHSYFMRPVEIGVEIRYEVERLREGRSYTTRHVRGYSGGKLAYIAMASFRSAEPGGDHAAAMPEGLPDPDALPTSAACLDSIQPGTRAGGTMTKESKAYWSSGRGFDMRHVPSPVYLTVEGATAPHQAVWVRPFDKLRPVDGLTSRMRDLAALAYVCDYTILEPILRVLGLPWALPGLTTASLDHAMWFHRHEPVDDWLLYAQEAGSAQNGRGLGLGRFFSRDGRHLATVAQEGVIRVS